MEFKKFGDTYVVRMDKGEEILEDLKILAQKENIKLASVQGLGAVGKFTVGALNTTTKQYTPTEYTGDHEITSLVGTIDTMNGAFYTHIHMSAAQYGTNMVVGGHLKEAYISGTGEIIVRVLDGEIDRKLHEEIGLNLFSFE